MSQLILTIVIFNFVICKLFVSKNRSIMGSDAPVCVAVGIMNVCFGTLLPESSSSTR